MKVRKILHMDLDAFFCSVEELRDPALKREAICCWRASRQQGGDINGFICRSKIWCPFCFADSQGFAAMSAIDPGFFHSQYEEMSKKVMAIVGDFTPLVETLSIDEAFMDVSDMHETPLQLARNLQSRINCETNLPCSIGAATNMLVAKIANDFGKHQHKEPTPPNAITIVEPGTEMEFLAPLPIDALWGVGPKTAERLFSLGIQTVGDLAKRSPDEMHRLFGQSGIDLVERARGMDDRQIQTEHDVKSISQETTFDQDIGDRDVLIHTIRRLSSRVGSQLRKQGLKAKTVRIKIRWANFETHTRQVSLSNPTDHDSVIVGSAIDLFNKVWPEGKKVRLIGVGTAQFSQEPVQLNLLDATSEKETRLLRSVDDLRQRFGQQIVFHGYEIKEKSKGNG